MISCAASLLLAQAGLAAPVNDNFDNATVISTSMLGTTILGSNIGATAEPGEPQFISFASEKSPALGGKSVWWKLTPTTDSTVTVSTAGSSFDTQLAVYTGNTVSNLTAVADNDDAPGVTNGTSLLSFSATAGTIYHILVDGFGGAEGSIDLAVAGVNSVGGAGSPKVTITAPKANSQFTNADITVTGTAAGATNDALAQVIVQVNSGAAVVADGTSNWTATVTLAPGSNEIEARSVTVSGAESVAATRNVTLIFASPLTILTNGPGSVVLSAHSTNINVGSVVRLRAVPTQDSVFTGWTGATNSTNANLSFVMTTNAVLTANFAALQFASVQGSYNGLALNDTPAFGNSGLVTLSVNRNATFTGRLFVGGRSFPLSGKFDTNGQATVTSKQGGTNLTTALQVDFTNETDQVTGTVTGPDFTSTLLADRATFDSKTNLAPFAGLDNLIIQTNDVIGGDGIITLNVNGAGSLTLSGRLADGTPFSQNVFVSKTGAWPLFASVYNGKGAVFGWMTFTNLPTTSVAGVANWFKPATGRNTFTNVVAATNLDVIGSLVITPPPKNPILGWTNGIAVLSRDDFMMPLTNMITILSNNTIVPTFQVNSLKLTSDNRGALRGSFVHPMTQRTDSLFGVLLPKTNWGAGFFTDTNGPGMLYIASVPPADPTAVITPPAVLPGGTLTLTPDTKVQTGAFRTFAGNTFSFTTTNVTSSATAFGPGTYSYSSQPSTGVNVVELNIAETTLGSHPAVIRMLLNFLTDTTGTYLASVTAGGSGLSAGTFSATPGTPPPPPATP